MNNVKIKNTIVPKQIFTPCKLNIRVLCMNAFHQSVNVGIPCMVRIFMCNIYVHLNNLFGNLNL